MRANFRGERRDGVQWIYTIVTCLLPENGEEYLARGTAWSCHKRVSPSLYTWLTGLCLGDQGSDLHQEIDPPSHPEINGKIRWIVLHILLHEKSTDVNQTQVQVKQIKIFLFASRNERDWVSSQLHARLVGQSIDSYYTVDVKRVDTMACRVGRGTLICERWMAYVKLEKDNLTKAESGWVGGNWLCCGDLDSGSFTIGKVCVSGEGDYECLPARIDGSKISPCGNPNTHTQKSNTWVLYTFLPVIFINLKEVR